MKSKILFVIDKIELLYFENNDLVTSFWLIKEFLLRNYDVYITTIDKLTLNGSNPGCFAFKTEWIEEKEELIYQKPFEEYDIHSFSLVFFRPDPPVDPDYINATYVFDFVDKNKTRVVNNPTAIRQINEKLYINHFLEYIPENITTSNVNKIKEFLNEYEEIIIKPINKCFSKNVFFVKKGDKNINSIVDAVTESGKTLVMVQKYIPSIKEGEKRINILGGQVLQEALVKLSTDDDFKFNTHKDEFFKKSYVTEKEYEACSAIAKDLEKQGILMAGVDIIDETVIEINVTSPCFFIREINSFYKIELEKTMVNYFESLLKENTVCFNK